MAQKKNPLRPELRIPLGSVLADMGITTADVGNPAKGRVTVALWYANRSTEAFKAVRRVLNLAELAGFIERSPLPRG